LPVVCEIPFSDWLVQFRGYSVKSKVDA